MLEVSSWGEKYYIDFDDYLAAANTVKDYGHRVSDSEFVDIWIIGERKYTQSTPITNSVSIKIITTTVKTRFFMFSP